MFQRTTKVSDLSLLSDTARRMAQKHPCHFSVRSVLIVFLLSSLLLTVAPVMVLWTLASQAGLEKTTSALYENIVGDITTFVNTFIEDATVTLVQNSNIVKVSPEICTDPVAYENLWRLLAANSLTLSNSIYTGNPYECLVGARSLPDKTMMIQCNSTGFDWIACNFETEPVVETTMCISWGQGYRPTLKQWYQLPVEAGFNVVTWTPFYNFYSTLGIGFTVSVAVPDPANTQRLCAVFALDYQMFVLQNFFQNLSVAKTGWALMFEASGGFLIASGNENVPVIINDTRTSLWDLSTQEARDIAEILYSDFGEEVTAVFSPQGIFHCRGDVAGQVVDLTIKSERFASTLDDWVIVSVVPSADYFTRQKDTLIITACSATGIFLVLGFIVIGASFCLTTPIKYVSRELEALSRLDEGAMSKATIGPGNTIKESKKKVGLREIESLEESAESVRLMLASFGKYVPMEVVKWYLNGTAECKLGVRRRQCSILFCDIEDFSRLTEQVPPELMIALFTRFMDICHNAIQIENGIVDKIVGDEIMAVWGATVNLDNPDLAACNCAIRIQESLKELRKEHEAAGLPLLFARIGISSGEVLAGNSGSTNRFCYTVMGSNVNLASRLENLNKYYGSRILISESVYQNTFMPSMQPHLDFTCRKLGIVATKGMLSGTGVYELIHVYKEDSTVHLCNEFSMCTQLKETKAFDECVMRLQQLHKEFPDDTITERALTEARILQVQKESGEIGEVWSPVLHFNTKF